MHPGRLSVLVSIAAVGWAAFSGTMATAGQPADATAVVEFADEVSHLASPEPARRRVAQHRLRRGGEGARAALVAGLRSSDLEVRLASRQILEELDRQYIDTQLARLSRGDAATEIDLPAWPQFVSLAGDAPLARELFAGMTRRYGDAMRWIDRVATRAPGLESEEDVVAEVDRWLRIDPARMNDCDTPRWAVLLLAVAQRDLATTPVLSSRLRAGLLAPSVRRHLCESQYSDVVSDLVAGWLHASSRDYVNATMLKLALIYGCDDLGVSMAQRTLASRHASPSEVAMSMIVITRLDAGHADTELRRRIDDARVCHVWQIVAARRRAIQTQVSDVAVALLLYLEDQDPREFGFQDLEADPETIFCEFSMGFEDSPSRKKAYALADAFFSGQRLPANKSVDATAP